MLGDALSFWQIISHCAKTRHLKAGTIIGSGTVAMMTLARAVVA